MDGSRLTDVSALAPADLAAVRVEMRRAAVETAGPLTCSLIAGGRSNLTFRLDDGVSRWVMRMPPRLGRTPSAHDVAREFRVTTALAAADVPVARPVVLCEDESVIGSPFAVAEFVSGRTIQSRQDLEALDDRAVGLVGDRLVDTLARLHAVDHVAVGLEGFGRAEGYAERQVRRWSGQWEIVGDPVLTPMARELGARLARTRFTQGSTGIVHGDYRIDNTILDLPADPSLDGPRIAAVVDWELSTLGDPVADVALMCVYRHAALDLVLGSPSAWTSPRLPAPDQLASAYEKAGGVPLVDWERHLALGYTSSRSSRPGSTTGIARAPPRARGSTLPPRRWNRFSSQGWLICDSSDPLTSGEPDAVRFPAMSRPALEFWFTAAQFDAGTGPGMDGRVEGTHRWIAHAKQMGTNLAACGGFCPVAVIWLIATR